ncbi:MAG: flippase-like domain-containing protein [Lentimicrobium sp.]|nr:flippase-like domain-containing protein [Lentimicrobium sp.]
MPSQQRRILQIFAFRRIIIPVILGFAVIIYMILNDLTRSDMASINWRWYSVLYFFLAFMMMVVRDVAYMYRIRLLTGNTLSWRKSFEVIMLWEFASSVTPSVVGGSAIAIFILTKEKLGIGRSTAIVVITAMLDELFYIVMVPLIFLIAGYSRASVAGPEIILAGSRFSTMGVFFIGYAVILFLILLIAYGIFINPGGLKWLLVKITSLKPLLKFREGATVTGDQVIVTSAELRGKSVGFWAKAFGSTIFSWTARFWVVNFLIMAFIGPVNLSDNMLILARQLMMWVIMLISPTPGGSGIAEYFFPIFLREFIAGTSGDLTTLVALAWRTVSYYPYLIIGAIVLPLWLRRIYLGRKLISFSKTKKNPSKKSEGSD